MKKKTSLISITQEEMKQTLAGGSMEQAPIDGIVDASQPGHQCSAWCHCACYGGYFDAMNLWAQDGDFHAGHAYTFGGIAVIHDPVPIG